MKKWVALALAGSLALLGQQAAVGANTTPAMSLETAAVLAAPMPLSDLADESIYFMMTDRYADGDWTNNNNGFNDANPGYFHGGDLKGLLANLDRIEDMGFTAIWITPVVLQKAVQGGSAAYHGYWGLDFTSMDPHFGTEQDLRNLVDALHSRGMKIYLDIVMNHTADVITLSQYNTYKSLGSFPYKNSIGVPFNVSSVSGLPSCTTSGQTGCFPLLDANLSFPQTFTATGNDAKGPAFLRDVTNYHHRGNINDWGNREQSQFGDFYGLDDIFSEKPEVVEGWAEVWAQWVLDFNIDGFRIDTIKHLDDKFFPRWTPLLYSKVLAGGGDLPEMFGEDFTTDRSKLTEWVRNKDMQSVLDFPMDQAVTEFASGMGTLGVLRTVWSSDDAYNRGAQPGVPSANVYSLVTFLGNHDMGRIGLRMQNFNNTLRGTSLLQRTQMAYAMLMFMRGAPTVYYGDEVGMIGVAGDKEARQDMFPTFVPSWRDQERLGSAPIGFGSSLEITSHPMMDHITAIQALREAHPALKSGVFQVRTPSIVLPSQVGKKCYKKNQKLVLKSAGWTLQCVTKGKALAWKLLTTRYDQVAAWSRFDRSNDTEYVVLANTSNFTRTVKVQTSSLSTAFNGIFASSAAAQSNATGLLQVSVPARKVIVLKAAAPVSGTTQAPTVTVSFKKIGSDFRPELNATLSATRNPVTVTFVARDDANSEWFVLGSDDSASYKLGLSKWMTSGRSGFQVAAIVETTDGKVSVSPYLQVTF